MIYETKGLTLEQVDELYSQVKNARESPGWKPSLTFTAIQSAKAQEVEHKEVVEERHEFGSENKAWLWKTRNGNWNHTE